MNPFDVTFQAIRSGTLNLPVPEDMAALADEERKQLKKQQLADQKKLNEIKSLKNHPGWKQIKQDILDKRIEDYRSGESLRNLVNDPKMTNDELGKRLRESMAVADEIQLIVNIIENAGSDEE